MSLCFVERDCRVVMADSDLHPRNITVAKENSEKGRGHRSRAKRLDNFLVKWELSGYYLEYSESVKAPHALILRVRQRTGVSIF